MKTIELQGAEKITFRVSKEEMHGLYAEAETDGLIGENLVGAAAELDGKTFKVIEQNNARRLQKDGSVKLLTSVLLAAAGDESRQIAFADQRRTAGFSDEEVWNLDANILRYLIPRLESFGRQSDCSVVRSLKQVPLAKIVNEIAAGFKLDLAAFEENRSLTESESEKFRKATELFWQYFHSFWI